MTTAVKSIDEIKAELESIRAKKAPKLLREKRDWYGLVYCDSNGWASIADFGTGGVWLGKTDEIIPYLKKLGINGENIDRVLLAVKDFRAEHKIMPLNSSEMPLRGSRKGLHNANKGITPIAKSNRAISGQKHSKISGK